MPTQKAASAVSDALGRGLIPETSRARLDALRRAEAIVQSFLNPIDAFAIHNLSDSTSNDPGTINEGTWPQTVGTSAGVRYFGKMAQMVAASSLDITVRYELCDFVNGGDALTQHAFQAMRILKTSTLGRRAARLPGSNNNTLYVPKSPRNSLVASGRKGYWAEFDIKSLAWFPGGNVVIFSDWDTASGTWGQSLGFQAATGRCWWSFTTDGTAATNLNRFSTAAPPDIVSLIDNTSRARIAFWVQYDNGAGGHSFSSWYRPDETTHTYTQIGTTVTDAGVITPFSSPTVPLRIGCRTDGGSASTNWAGDLYEIEIRENDRYGATILPMAPDSWSWNSAFMPMVGGPQVTFVNATYPGRGVWEFSQPVYMARLTPRRPYRLGILNTAHNDEPVFGAPGSAGYPNNRQYSTARDRFAGLDLMRGLWQRYLGETVPQLMTSQNPTLRNDSLAGDPASLRYDHLKRIANDAAYCASRAGIRYVDTFNAMQDYVRAGGSLTDAGQLDSAVAPYVHPLADGNAPGYATRNIAMKLLDEIGWGEVAA